MKSFWRNNALSLVMFTLFVVFWVGQSVAGLHHYNQKQQDHGQPEVSYRTYLTSGEFIEATFENWESEFLQMGAFILLAAFLKQKGSSESRSLDEDEEADADPRAAMKADSPTPVHRGGLALKLYSTSLSLALFGLFAFSFVMHALGGMAEFNEEARAHGEATVSLLHFMGTSTFWFESLQNWQSEFLSVGVLVVLSIFLRQHGSPESKPVHAPHSQTGK